MRSESRGRLASVVMTLVMTLAGAAGCQTPLCFPQVDPDNRYRADVIERYDEQSQYTYTFMIGAKPGGTSGTCAPLGDGVGPGASLAFEGTGTFVRMHSCSGVTADLDPQPPGIAIVGPASSLAVQSTVSAYGALIWARDVTFGQCAGTLGLAVLPGAGTRPDDFFLAPTPGEYPHAVLLKMFAPSDPTDAACPSCYDDFVIQFSKL